MVAPSLKLPTSGLLLVAVLLIAPKAASAQYRPGIERGDYWGDVRSKYRSETLERVGGLMDGWLQSWNAPPGAPDRLDGMVDQFAEDGVLVLNGTVINGEDRIREALEGRPSVQITQSLSDFDVRGDMAFVAARYRSGTSRDRGALVSIADVALWVFVKEGKDWRIRSLVLDFAP